MTNEEIIIKSVDMMMAQPLEKNTVDTFQSITDAFLALDRCCLSCLQEIVDAYPRVGLDVGGQETLAL